MSTKISKSNDSLAFFNSRLDEIRMNGHERLKAKAHLARAEAMADLFLAAVHAIGRLLKPAPAKPVRQHAPSAG
jgi:hypothetical protein